MQNGPETDSRHTGEPSIPERFLDAMSRLTQGFAVMLRIDPPPSRPPMTDEEMNRRIVADTARDWQATGDDMRFALRDFEQQIGRKEK